jgi:O-antigen ligase
MGTAGRGERQPVSERLPILRVLGFAARDRLRPALPAGAGASLLAGLGLALGWWTTPVAVLGAALLALSLLQPVLVFLGLLAIRSSLDIFTDMSVYLGALKFNPPAFASLFLDWIGVLFITNSLLSRRRLRLTPVGLAFLGWLVVLMFWAWQAYANFGSDGLIAVREWVRLASLFVIFVIALNGAARWGERRILGCLFAALLTPLTVVLLALGSRIWSLDEEVGRLSGTIAHPNSLALFLVLYIALTLRQVQIASRRLPWRALLVLEIVAFVATFSLNGILMLLVMIAVFALGCPRGSARRLAVLAFVGAVALFLASDYGRLRIASLQEMPDLQEVVSAGTVTNSTTWRVYHWKLLTMEWLKRPVLGYGLHTTDEMVSPWRSAPHNDYLRYLVETGALGMLLYLGFLLTVGRSLYLCVRRKRRAGEPLSLALVALAVFCVWIVGSLGDNIVTNTTFQYSFWALLGVVMSENEKVR